MLLAGRVCPPLGRHRGAPAARQRSAGPAHHSRLAAAAPVAPALRAPAAVGSVQVAALDSSPPLTTSGETSMPDTPSTSGSTPQGGQPLQRKWKRASEQQSPAPQAASEAGQTAPQSGSQADTAGASEQAASSSVRGSPKADRVGGGPQPWPLIKVSGRQTIGPSAGFVKKVRGVGAPQAPHTCPSTVTSSHEQLTCVHDSQALLALPT